MKKKQFSLAKKICVSTKKRSKEKKDQVSLRGGEGNPSMTYPLERQPCQVRGAKATRKPNNLGHF